MCQIEVPIMVLLLLLTFKIIVVAMKKGRVTYIMRKDFVPFLEDQNTQSSQNVDCVQLLTYNELLW